MPDNNNGSPFSRYFRTGSSSPDQDESKNQLKMSKAKTKWLQRMVLEVNKFPYSNAKIVGLYAFERNELEWYYKEIRLLVDKVLDILECPYCEDTVKMAIMPGCGCDNPLVCCSKCWLEEGSQCPSCKRHCTSLPFEPVDEVIKECHLFLKEKAYNNAMKCRDSELKRLSESYFQFLKQSEMQLMCNYCFGTLENAMTVNRGNGTRTPVCKGCHELYMECYTSCTDVSPFPSFDRLNREYGQFFSRVLTFCSRNKTQVYKDPYPGMKQPTYLRKTVLQRQGIKGKLFGMFKKAMVVAACAYLVVYFAQ